MNDRVQLLAYDEENDRYFLRTRCGAVLQVKDGMIVTRGFEDKLVQDLEDIVGKFFLFSGSLYVKVRLDPILSYNFPVGSVRAFQGVREWIKKANDSIAKARHQS